MRFLKELITIVVPIYNVEEYLNKCIETILCQTYENIEILLIDDGSTDNCGNICDLYAKKDSRVKVIHKENGGLSDARNTGIEAANGKYICFIDSDDYISPIFIETLYNLCKENNTKISQCSFNIVYDNNGKSGEAEQEVNIYTSEEMVKNLYNEKYVETVIVCDKLYDITLFKNIKFPKGKINEDEAITYKLFYEAESICTTNLKLYFYRKNLNSITNSKFTLKNLYYLSVLKERDEFFKEKGNECLVILNLKTYFYSLVKSYCKCKLYIKDSADIRRKIKVEYKKVYKVLISSQVVKLKTKCLLTFAGILPMFYYKCFGVN